MSKNKNLWLDEENLYEDLKYIFGKDFIRNKIVPKSNCKYRPDFRNDELMLIVQYDGPRHYTDSKVILKDDIEDTVYQNLNYKIVRVPYYIQIETKIIKLLFDINFEYELKYPHGFNEKNVILPANFCSLGLKRFERELDYFDIVKENVIDTLLNKIEENNYNSEIVIPDEFIYIIDPDIHRDIIKDKKPDDSQIFEEILLKSLFYIENDYIRKNFLNTFIERRYYYYNSLFNEEGDLSYYLSSGIKKCYKENIEESLNKDNDYDLYLTHIQTYLNSEEDYFNQIKNMLKK